MRLSFLTLLIIYSASLAAQPVVKDTTISVDVLRAPASPAANLAGIAPSEVEKPTDATAFRFSLQQATNNFSQLPKSYAVDLTPGLMFNSRNLTVDRFLKNDFSNNFKQTFTFSAAIRNLDANEEDSLSRQSTRLALGFKFSVLRGDVDKGAVTLFNEIKGIQSILINKAGNEMEVMEDTDIVYQNAIKNMVLAGKARPVDSVAFYHWQSVAQERLEKITQSVLANYTAELADLKSKATDFKITRYGWKLDVAGGVAIDFLEQRFNNSRVTKAGAWVTGGYEWKGLTWLGIARYLFNPDKIFADDKGVIQSATINTVDLGTRLVYSYPQSKFSLSSEAIYRSVVGNKEVPSSWRFTVNADYDVGHNQKLTFAFGRDFDGTVSKGGNVIAALQFLMGFGSKKTVK